MTSGAAYEQHSTCTAGIFLLPLGLLNAVACLEPLERQLEFRIGEAGSCFPLARALVVFVVRLPSDVDDLRELWRQILEFRIGEALTESSLELAACELDIALTSPHVHHGWNHEA